MTRRRWRAPEVVQTSAMDCGPAALKCVLEGHGIPVSYGRLREACQTDVDGTSIDTIEVVANQLGVVAEQVMIPLDHLFLAEAEALPAIVVVRQPGGATHFVVAWRRVGRWLQVMDPASGRHWLRCERFVDDVLRHETAVDAGEWRAWAGSDDFLRPLGRRLADVGVGRAQAAELTAAAGADPGWFGFGALDAALRLVRSLVDAGAIGAGAPATRLVRSLVERTLGASDDIHAAVPAEDWSATPDPASTEATGLRLRLRGAVLLRVRGAAPTGTAPPAPLSRELAAALAERPPHPLRTVWTLLREDGLLAPAALVGAVAVAAGALVVEALLFRGIFDIAWQLGLASQRLLALLALVAFAALVLALEVPIILESLRLGRHLETRLRVALLAKLPRLADRYFQSRSVSDMADRAHAIQAVRQLPQLGLNVLQSVAELALTLAGIALIAPASALPAAAIVLAAVVLSLAFQPLLNERDLRLRAHAAALDGVYLDALLGLVPVRTHRAERNLRRQHEGLLVEWAAAGRGMIATSLGAGALQQLVATGLAGWLVVGHFVAAGGVGGSDLLLVYWALKLPALGSGLTGLAQQYPAQRNVLLRLTEPLAAPEDRRPPPDIAAPVAPPARAVALAIDGGSVVAAGHEILRDVDLAIAPGEHVAIVGVSGAGKSSLVGLFLGWHRLAGGRLLVDGAAPDAGALDALRRATAWVDPGVQLWNRSLLDNLAYASDDDALARVGPVVDGAALRGVLEKLPQGLQTLLGEGGALLSGGEGQRVRLGRALLQTGVRLALLDEPFRGLDRDRRAALLAEVRRWWAGATLLAVTHDVGETLAFGRVLVVDDGRIVEDGPPAELAARAGSRYAALLAAEDEVRRRLWQDPGWRRVRIDGGLAAERPA